MIGAAMLALAGACGGEEQELKPLKDLEADAPKKNGQTFVTIKGGQTNAQRANLSVIDNVLGPVPFDHMSQTGSFVFGIEVGRAWKMKKFPFESALGFEGGFISTELQGALDPSYAGPLNADSPVGVRTDMNTAFFLLNGRLTLDLWRYRARLGRVVTRVRPYVGGGLGGGQIWFRNTDVLRSDGDTTMPAATDPFSSDAFTFAYQWFAGVELLFNERISLFGEYRTLKFDDTDDVENLEMESWQAGLRINLK